MASHHETSTESIEGMLRENFRLSSYEARAYLSLLKQGKQNPKQLSSMAEIPLPRVYDTLESLMTKGFVLKQDDTYSPIPPRQALRGRSSQFDQQFSLEQRKRKSAGEDLAKSLELLVPEPLEEGEKSPGEISILKGFNSIANKFAELLESSSEVILIAKRAMEAKEVFIPILLEFAERSAVVYSSKRNQRKKSNKGRIRIIIPKEANVTKDEADQARKARVEIRRSDHILFDMMITDQDDVIIGVPDPLSEEINHAIAIWVRNSSFAGSTRKSIEELWRRAEEV